MFDYMNAIKEIKAENVQIYSKKWNATTKEIFDYLKYGGVHIDKIYCDDARLNGHFEDVAVVNCSDIADITETEGINLLYEENGMFRSLHIEDFPVRLEVVDGIEYSDARGNQIINESGLPLRNVIFYGGNNRIAIAANAKVSNNARIELHSGSMVEIGRYSEIQTDVALVAYSHGTISIGDYATIEKGGNVSSRYDSAIHISDECKIRKDAYIFCKYGSGVDISEKCTFEQRTRIISVSMSTILIGSDFMGSFDVSIIGNDGHALVTDTGRYNMDAKTRIGNHVWCGDKTTVLTGSYIPDNCIIGANSVVTRGSNLESDTACAGVPAKILKRNVIWKRYI